MMHLSLSIYIPTIYKWHPPLEEGKNSQSNEQSTTSRKYTVNSLLSNPNSAKITDRFQFFSRLSRITNTVETQEYNAEYTTLHYFDNWK